MLSIWQDTVWLIGSCLADGLAWRETAKVWIAGRSGIACDRGAGAAADGLRRVASSCFARRSRATGGRAHPARPTRLACRRRECPNSAPTPIGWAATWGIPPSIPPGAATSRRSSGGRSRQQARRLARQDGEFCQW